MLHAKRETQKVQRTCMTERFGKKRLKNGFNNLLVGILVGAVPLNVHIALTAAPFIASDRRHLGPGLLGVIAPSRWDVEEAAHSKNMLETENVSTVNNKQKHTSMNDYKNATCKSARTN